MRRLCGADFQKVNVVRRLCGGSDLEVGPTLPGFSNVTEYKHLRNKSAADSAGYRQVSETVVRGFSSSRKIDFLDC